MTKKHFEAIAEIVANIPGGFDHIAGNDTKNARKALANELADYFQRENARFDRAKFLKACNVK